MDSGVSRARQEQSLCVLLVLMLGTSTMAVPPVFESSGAQPGERMVRTVEGKEFAFRWCPPGEFMMGCREVDRRHYGEYFTPQHDVRLTKGFWFQETEVTVAQYRKLMGEKEPGTARICPGRGYRAAYSSAVPERAYRRPPSSLLF